jgi:hypothetical protein
MNGKENITSKARLSDGTVKELRLEVSVDVPCELWQIQLNNFEENVVCFRETDLYKAMQALREYLEGKGCQLLCAGARPDVAPSGMSRSMGGGQQAYVMHLGKQSTELVDIFDYAAPALVGTVQKQREYFQAWIASLRFNWWLPLAALLGTPLIFLLLAISQPESLVYVFFVVPIISIFLIVCAVYSAIAGKKLRCRSILSMLAIFWALSVPLAENYLAVRSSARWLIWSDDYKAKVTAQPTSPNRDLKHLYWDGWGWGGENTTVYLVFDPADSLSAAANSHQPGKLDGLPCKVDRVFRLERDWYAAQFYTGTDWDHCN